MTIFEKILRKEIPAHIVFENERVLAFKDIAPQAPVHVLVIPKKSARDLSEMSSWNPTDVGQFFIDVSAVAKSLNLKGFRLVMNTGAEGGQTVFYAHAHILAGELSGEFA